MPRLLRLMIFVVFIIYSSCSNEDPTIIGLYQGTLSAYQDNDLDNVLVEVTNAKLSVTSCNASCIELSFVTSRGSTNAIGEVSQSGDIFNIVVTPVYEFPGNPQSWEEEWLDGAGIYNNSDGSISLNLTVDDSQSIGGTDAVYFYEGNKQ